MIGVGYRFGKVNSEYTDPIPDRGDVPQRHSFSTPVLTVRVRQAGQGLFAEGSTTFFGETSAMEFQAIDGWNTKKRDQDDSRDTAWAVKAGYKFGLADTLTLGGFAGWSRLCLCEQYEAQGATTTTERSYSGLIVGAELAGATDSDDHQVSVIVTGEFGPKLTRKSWTHQLYPGIDFPRVDHVDEDAKSFGFRAEADVQVVGIIHAMLAYDYLGVSSTRPEPYQAHERLTVNAITVGMNIVWGR